MVKNNLVVDLHLHSHYSRATSKDLDLVNLYYWGKLKGIHVIGTGDFTHPLWLKELEESLEEQDNGLFALKPELASPIQSRLPQSFREYPLFFVPTVEVSCIYRREDKTRKVHNVIVMPDFASVRKLNTELAKYGKLAVDGRPTLMLDSQELVELTFDINKQALFIPAHIWTPWFGVMGSKSGFDSLTEAFGESLSLVSAVETGLSSDPEMNRQLSALDHLSLVSFSDAHSPRKLGREATVVSCELSYQGIANSIKTGEGLVGTYEFYPQEGKYYADGHVRCGVCMSREEVLEHGSICPVCNRPLTIGVNHRIQALADKKLEALEVNKKVWHLIPLEVILAQVLGLKSTSAKRVQQQYLELVTNLTPEFELLLHTPIELIAQQAGAKIASAISLVRQGQLEITPGYDGVYGEITIPDLEHHTDTLPLLNLDSY